MVTTTAQRIVEFGGMHAADIPSEYWDVIDQYRSKLLKQARAILGNHDDAEEVVQETFCDAFNARQKLSKARSISAWLQHINRCKALNRLRARRRSRANLARSERDIHSVTTGGFSGIELRDAVTRLIEGLPPTLRALFVLRYYENLSYQEIAERLKIPAGTVGYLFYDASTQLHAKLRALMDAPPQPSADEEKQPS